LSTKIRFIVTAGAAALVLASLNACGGGIPANAVARVGETSITKAAFEHWMSVAATSISRSTTTQTAGKPVVPDPPTYTACVAHLKETEAKLAKGQKPKTEAALKSDCEQQYTSLKQQVLGFLISSEWVIGEASRLGVNVSDNEVKKELLKLKRERFPKEAEFQQLLKRTGMTVSDLLLRIKAETLLPPKIEQKVTKKKAISQSEVEKYYNAHRTQFGTQEKRKVQIVLTKTEAQAKKAKREMQSGRSFESVAKSKSIDPTSKSNGGLLPEVTKGEEEAALDTAIFSASKNVLSGPVKTPFGYYIFEVLGSTPGTQQTLTQAKTSIKQQLAATRQQTALDEFIKEFRKRWTAETNCRPGYVVADCRQYKAPKADSLGAPNTTTPHPTTTAPRVTKAK
jgi:foldase protein PrsA